MSRRTRQRRTRPRRDKGQGVSPPARSMAQAKEYQWTERDVEQLKELHAARSWQAQRTDEALVAPIAPSPGHWIKTPGEYDVHGVDYPELKTPKAKRELEPHQRMKEIEAKPPRVDDQKIANPMGSPDKAKKYLADVVEKYRRKLGIKGEVKLSAQNRGAPARIRHYKDGKTPQIEVNYSHFADLWTDAPELTQKYLEYGIAHEMAHQRQYEDLGHRGYQKAFTKAKAEGEWDADGKALRAMGITRKELEGSLDQLAKKVNGVHETAHQPFKGTPNIERFKDTTPPEKPKAASTRDQMRATYIKALGGIIPTATQEEVSRITEKAMTEEWIKPDDDAKTARKRVGDLAKAELVKLRQAKAHLERDEQMKRLKELHEKAEAKTSDEERHRQRLAQLREDYGAQYDTALNAAMDINVKGYSRKLHQDLRNMGYSYTEAAEMATGFDEKFVTETQGEALKKLRQDSMEAARDAFGEAPELWEDAVKKYMATEVAQRPIPGVVEDLYVKVKGSIRDRTKPPEPVTPIIPKKPTVKTSTESYDYYMDPGHGWLRVPVKKLEELGIADDISNASYVKGGYAYLEEDRDATIFTEAMESLGVKVNLRDHTSNRESSIRGYQPHRKLKDEEKPVLTPTQEARRRYSQVIANRVPRMADTWRLNLNKTLLDQGFSGEAAKAISDRLTEDAVYTNQNTLVQNRRVNEGTDAQRAEVQAERDALAAVQNEYEKLKKEALEDWAIARRKTTAISQDPETKRILEGYKSEQPEQQGATVKATPSMRSRVASMSFNEANALIRDHVKAHCSTVSVRKGRGTAAGWLELTGSDEYGRFTDTEKQQLEALGITVGGNHHGMDFGDKVQFIERNKLLAEKPAPAKDEVVIDIPDKKPAATYDAETEKIIKRIQDEKEVSRVLVEKRIEEEKEKAAGLITNEAAATFVAYQMLGEPVGKTAWAKISMNQMGGYFRVNEYSPT
ncbi:MAG: hypothetical protein ABIJ47_01340, partial [Candidatus Bathyarchaeota archaeon]